MGDYFQRAFIRFAPKTIVSISQTYVLLWYKTLVVEIKLI